MVRTISDKASPVLTVAAVTSVIENLSRERSACPGANCLCPVVPGVKITHPTETWNPLQKALWLWALVSAHHHLRWRCVLTAHSAHSFLPPICTHCATKADGQLDHLRLALVTPQLAGACSRTQEWCELTQLVFLMGILCDPGHLPLPTGQGFPPLSFQLPLNSDFNHLSLRNFLHLGR